MKLIKQKIKLATSSIRGLAPVLICFLTVLYYVSAADVESPVISTSNPNTIPQSIIQSSQIAATSCDSQLAELTPIEGLTPIEKLTRGARWTKEQEDIAPLTQPTYNGLSILSLTQIKGSQGCGD